MRNFIFILLFCFVSVFAQVQNQQQRADNGKPFTVAIHRLNNLALNDSLLMETEDTTNFFSRRTSVGQLKTYVSNYVNSEVAPLTFFYQLTLLDSTFQAVQDSAQIIDSNGDSCKLVLLQYERNAGCSQYEFYIKTLTDNDPIFNIPEYSSGSVYLIQTAPNSKPFELLINYQIGGPTIVTVKEVNTLNDTPSDGTIILNAQIPRK